MIERRYNFFTEILIPSEIDVTNAIAAQENGAFLPVFVQFKDTRGNDLASGTQGYINRPANMTRGTLVNGQEWSVIVERLDMLVGGSGAL